MLATLLQFTIAQNPSASFQIDTLTNGVFKLLFVAVAFIYVVFALVVTRQIKVMRTTLITTFSPVIRVIGYVHFFLALAVLVLFVLFL